MMPTIYINGRFLTQKMTGQQRFSCELVTALDRRLQAGWHGSDDPRVVLLVPAAAAPESTLDLRRIELRRVGRLRGHAWDQIDLARHAAGGVLVSLCGTGPLAHLRHIVTIHDAAPFANPHNFTPAFRRAYGVLIPTLAKLARRVLTVSDFSKAEIAHYCGIDAGKIEVVGNGADHILRAPADAAVLDNYGLAGRRYVLAVGSLSINKNFGLVVDAFNRLQRDDLVLAVAGGQNAGVFARYPLRETANVVRLGYVSDPALRALYENALCFVLPSLYEGFGIPPVEAMLCGCPTIISTAPALVEISSDGALVCDPHDPDALAELIGRLADDDGLRRQMRERGLTRGRRFTWEASAERLAAVLHGFGHEQPLPAVGRPA
ncbi:MAG: glycosyltransferase family 4 protein [Rhodospirillales bacterium]|nr:glycosyltransferase family 4 protein [Rhodospirillales bacterium]